MDFCRQRPFHAFLILAFLIISITIIFGAIEEYSGAFIILFFIILPILIGFGVYFYFKQKLDRKYTFIGNRRKLEVIKDSEEILSGAEYEMKTQGVDIILCYNCRDIFIEEEKKCDKCGSPKPRCRICNLDLTPETDPSDTIIMTPCCSIYVHIEHMLEWLEIKEICPNCKQKLTKEQLIQSHIK